MTSSAGPTTKTQATEIARAALETGVVTDVAVVTDTSDHRRRLVAYVVGPPRASVALVRRHLRDALPARLLPDVVVPVSAIPRDGAGRPVAAGLPSPVPPLAFTNTPRDQWELSVADLWIRRLGLVEVGINDPLDALGGDAVVVEEMRAELADTFDAPLPASAITLATTVAELAPRVRTARGRSRTRHATLVPLSRDGAGTPLFCFGGAGGLALRQLGLAHHFRGERPVYGLQPHGLEARGLADWTVRAAAARHVRSIRGVRAHGPYLLAGHSFGGLVAHEAAQILTDAGEEVALLALIDSFTYDSPAVAVPLTLRAKDPDARERAAAAADAAVRAEITDADAAPAGFEPTSRLGAGESQTGRVRIMTNRLRQLAQLPVAGLVPLTADHQLEVFFNQGRIVTLSHRPKPWRGRAIIYSADDGNTRTWLKYLPGDQTRAGTMVGDHDGILREPAVAHLADDLRAEFAALGV
jgi:thioesterase domain-containing protein